MALRWLHCVFKVMHYSRINWSSKARNAYALMIDHRLFLNATKPAQTLVHHGPKGGFVFVSQRRVQEMLSARGGGGGGG